MDINWFDEFAVNVAEMDGQHVKIFALIGRLRRGVEEKNERAAVEEVLLDLLDYTQKHFSREEQIMKEHEYPNLAKHKAEHSWLLAEVLDRKKKFEQEGNLKATELGAFLYNWLKDHIAITDKEYGKFLNSRGIQ
ncbi:MAG: bacteriohemerythrin [Nitrospinota bacterium]|nr:bacteriohemerythrin [Nitrospinota bacterium]